MTDYRKNKVDENINFKDVLHAICFILVFYGVIAMACVG